MTNVLILWTDQQRCDTLACYGNKRGVMPELDRFAGDCTVFDRCYCSSPVCTPSRGSLMTGLMPHRHGALTNNVPLAAGSRCLPELLAGHDDYATGYVGKWHLGDELFAQHGFAEWVGSEDGYQQFFSPDRGPETRSPFHEHLIAKGYRPDPADPWIRDWSMKLPERDSKPAFIVDRAIDFVERHRDRPWILSVNTLEPHHPLMGPRADDFVPADIPAWPNLDHADPAAPPFVRCQQERYAAEGFEDFHCRDETSWRLLGAHYWGQCRQVDRQFARLLARLGDLGLYDDTLIVFTSDHGEMLGCQKLFGKGVPYEESARIPLLVKMPGQREPHRIAAPVSNVDVAPTLSDLLDHDPGVAFDGRSLAKGCRGGAVEARDVLVVWNRPDAAPDQRRSPKDGAWRCLVTPEGPKYTSFDDGTRMLHDLAEDPYELHDRAAGADSERLDEFDRRLRVAASAVGDDRFTW